MSQCCSVSLGWSAGPGGRDFASSSVTCRGFNRKNVSGSHVTIYISAKIPLLAEEGFHLMNSYSFIVELILHPEARPARLTEHLPPEVGPQGSAPERYWPGLAPQLRCRRFGRWLSV